MSEILEFLKGFNIQNILSLFLIIWYFSRDIKASIEKLDHDLIKMNTRVSRLEGTVFGKGVYNSVEE